MSINSHIIFTLFLALIIILALNPRIVSNIYSSILGRVCLIGIVILLSMKSITLGLLVALTIIAGLNHFGSFTEGLENMDSSGSPTTVGEDNIPITGKKVVLTNSETDKNNDAKKRVSDLKTIVQSQGVDKEDIKTTLMSKDSNTIQVPSKTTNDNVEAFTSTMLTPSTLTKGFYSASSV